MLSFMRDVYIYGTLHYEFPPSVSFGGTSVTLEDLTVTGIASFNNLYVSGVSTFVRSSRNQFRPSRHWSFNIHRPIDAVDLDIDHIDVGIAKFVCELLELRNDDGTLHAVGFASGPRAGSVGIGSDTLPERSIDVDDVRILSNIFDSVNSSGC